jgi:spore germination protein KB
MENMLSIDKTQISGTRFMFTVAFFLQSSALLTAFIAGNIRHDSWLAVMFGAIVSIPLIFLYRSIMVEFPDKNFLQVLEEVFGKVAGKILGAGMVWFFLTLSALNVTDLGNFAKITVMRETPHIVLTTMCIIVAVWAVRYGVKVVARYSALFTFIEFAIVAVSIILTINQLDLKNFLPMFDFEPIKYIQGTHIVLTIPFGELVVLLMLAPNCRLSKKNTTKYWFGGFAMGAVTLLIVLMRDIAILGNTIQVFTLPGLVTLRLVNLGEALSRMEILFAVAVIVLLFFKVTILGYASVVAIAQLTNFKSYRRLALVVGMFIIVYAPTLYNGPTENATSAREFVPFLWSLFEIIIPLAAYVVGKIRKLGKKENGAPAVSEGIPKETANG